MAKKKTYFTCGPNVYVNLNLKTQSNDSISNLDARSSRENILLNGVFLHISFYITAFICVDFDYNGKIKTPFVTNL